MSPPTQDNRPAGSHSGQAPIAVSLGDPAGIGPDIALMAWAARARWALPAFALFGDPGVISARARALGLALPIAPVSAIAEAGTVFASALPVRPVPIAGAGEAAADAATVAAIEQAVAAAAGGEALALVTNPIVKRTLDLAHLAYPGHTEFLADLALRHGASRRPRPVMMLAADELKVVPATVHIPLAEVPKALTRGLLVETCRITAAALAEDFGIARPRIAVAGLNPHAGEGGRIGREDAALIRPAIEELAAEGIAITGPHSADTLFHAEARSGYDAAVAMYHDQALIPIKTLAFDRGVNVTLGLPFVRTSPDHGTAFALAGTGRARPGSFIAALRMASEIGQRRAAARATPQP
ncbi:MAG TPA: 4-hydroxythreonine-4-phosphate dehydrogenase PdxA [Hyphomicrobiaceae bacterium]|nr:4-hydroxythreonine-4-phosphate dehydrogenase PdxA [Hyphomicrobiaceae bacterium]